MEDILKKVELPVLEVWKSFFEKDKISYGELLDKIDNQDNEIRDLYEKLNKREEEEKDNSDEEVDRRIAREQGWNV